MIRKSSHPRMFYTKLHHTAKFLSNVKFSNSKFSKTKSANQGLEQKPIETPSICWWRLLLNWKKVHKQNSNAISKFFFRNGKDIAEITEITCADITEIFTTRHLQYELRNMNALKKDTENNNNWIIIIE